MCVCPCVYVSQCWYLTSGTPWAVPGHVGEDKHTRDMEFLESYADKQWEVSVEGDVVR